MADSVNQIFISYRREDSAAITGRIYDRLVQKFGREAVFKDVDSMPLGVNFRKRLDALVSECAVVLVVIGDRWIERLDDPRDFVRIEVESALHRDIPVVPLLVQDAQLPPEESLPEMLRELIDRNGLTIGHDPHFHGDINRLISSLDSLLGANPAPKASEEVTESRARTSAKSASMPATSPALEGKETVPLSADAPYPSMFSSRKLSPEEIIRSERQLRWLTYVAAPILGPVIPVLVAVLSGYAANSVFVSALPTETGHDKQVVFVGLACGMSMIWTLGVIGWLFGALIPLAGWKAGLWLSGPLTLIALALWLAMLSDHSARSTSDDLTMFTFILFATPLMPLLACVGVHVGKLYAARRSRR